MIHIYKGDGKGKTTASVGLLIRAAGSGKKCGFFSFLKTDTSSELKVLRKTEGVRVFDMPKKMPFVWSMTEKEKEEIKKYYEAVLCGAEKEKFDLLVLDEAVSAVCEGLADGNKILALAKNTELVLTGRGESDILESAADYITEMKKIRHPYDKGINAREGIEY